MSQIKQQPIFKRQLHRGIAAAVFEHKRDDRIFRSIDLQRSYYHNEKWHRASILLNHADIPFVIEALTETWRFLNESRVQLNPEDAAGMDDLPE